MTRVVDVGAAPRSCVSRAALARRPSSSPAISIDVELGAELLVAQRIGLHLDEVDDAAEGVLDADRQLDRRPGWRRGARGSASTQLSKSAPTRSILLTKAMRGTWYRSAWRHTVSDCGSTPVTASNTATAPSSTRSERSTSMVKSTWPGVSMMLMRWLAPEAGGRGGGDGDAALLLLLHPVHRRGALVDLADLVVDARVVEDALGRRGLTRVDVRHDPDVAGRRYGKLASHESVSRVRRTSFVLRRG